LWDRIFGTGFDLNKERENKEEVAKLMYVKKAPQTAKEEI
jgi:hypothetical protein